MLNVELTLKWIDALKSGRYQQSRKRLRTVDGFCCLGVLCDISGQGQWVLDDNDFGAYLISTTISLVMIPTEMRSFVGFSPDGCFTSQFRVFLGLYNLDDLPITLAKMNDSGETFEKIANVIYNALVFETLWGQPAFF